MVLFDIKINLLFRLSFMMERQMVKDINYLIKINIMLEILLIILLMEEDNTNLYKFPILANLETIIFMDMENFIYSKINLNLLDNFKMES
jgi:hypothetical protein